MATKNTGWKCTHSASIIENTNTYAKIRVTCYWQNDGWDYNISNVSAWVYCGSQSAKVKDNGKVNNDGQGLNATTTMGYADFTINKTTSSQNISCYGKITSNSTYVSGTKSSTAANVSVGAKPSYTVSYNANGGSGAPGNQTKWYGTDLKLSTTIPSATGHNFLGWATSASGAVAYAAGATYTGNANLTLYAKWQVHTYAVTYNANGGSGAPGGQTKTYNVGLQLSSTIPTRTNYNFLGWSTSASGGVEYAPGATYTTNWPLTLYAVWEWAYVKPRISNFSVYRCNSDGSANEAGNYAKITFNWSTDRAVSSIKIDVRSSTNPTWTVLTVSASGTSGTVSYIDNELSIEKSYLYRAYVTDSGGTTYSPTLTVGTVKFPIDIKAGGTGVAIGKVSEKDAFEVGMDMWYKDRLLDEFRTLSIRQEYGGTISSDNNTTTIQININSAYLFVNAHIYARCIVLLTNHPTIGLHVDVIYQSANHAVPEFTLNEDQLTITHSAQARGFLFKLGNTFCG